MSARGYTDIMKCLVQLLQRVPKLIFTLHSKIITGVHSGRYFRIIKECYVKLQSEAPFSKVLCKVLGRQHCSNRHYHLPNVENTESMEILAAPLPFLSSQVAPSNMLSESQLLNKTACHIFRISSLHSFYFLHSFIWVYFIL